MITCDKLTNSNVTTTKISNSTNHGTTVSCGYSECNRIQIESSMFKLCSRCEKICYCDKACQIAHWPEHKRSCKKTSSTNIKCTTLCIDCAVADSKNTALLIASHKGHDKCVLALLEYGVDVNVADVNNNTSLFIASRNGHDKCVSLLLQRGASINIANNAQSTSLMMASLGCHYNSDLLLQNDATVSDVDNNTPLFVASRNGHDKCVSLLLQRGASVNTANNAQSTSLMMASCGGHDKCVDLLLQNGADMNFANGLKCTALFMASHEGRDKCVQLLLNYGVDVNPVEDKGVTPLLAACLIGHIKCAALLLLNGADVNTRDKVGRTSVFGACVQGSANCLSLLISHGADVNIPLIGTIPRSPLQIARALGFDKCVSILIENGANETPTFHKVLTSDTMTLIQTTQKQSRIKRHVARRCDYPDCTNTECTVDEYQRCSGCKAVYYCGAEHQKLHWKDHKQLCHAIVK